MLSSTSSRVGRAQPWPTQDMAKAAEYGTALPRSASANSRLGDFPPSSKSTGLRDSAAVAMIRCAVVGPPVNDTLPTSGCRTSASPATPVPCTTLTTPSGRPASRATSAKSSAVKGVNSAGLMTTVLPAASEAGTFMHSESSGAFQVMMWPITPYGSASV